MIKQKLIECNIFERTEDEVTARAGLIMFDGFMGKKKEMERFYFSILKNVCNKRLTAEKTANSILS